VAELTFENHAMKSLTQKKSSKPGWEKTGCSIPYPGRAVQSQPGVQNLVRLPRSTYQYQAKPKDDSIIQEALTTMVGKQPTLWFLAVLSPLSQAGVRGGTTGAGTPDLPGAEAEYS
jgi:hypothetical protein